MTTSSTLETARPAPPAVNVDVRAARKIVDDLFTRNRPRYWIEFGLSIALAYLGLALFELDRPSSANSIVAYGVSMLATFRSLVFIHEIAHFRTGEFPSFRIGWNLLCGFPLLVPSFLYGNHWDHHARPTYGTSADSEYLPARYNPALAIVGLLVAAVLFPLVFILRFAVLFPLSLLIPPLRKPVERRFSSLAIQPGYQRDQPDSEECRSWYLQETVCFTWIAAVTAGVVSGIVDVRLVVLGYAIVVGAQLLNTLRLLVAHRYLSDGVPITVPEQVADSVDYPDGSTPDLWAPVGLRYHAVHHLFPAMPYHSLAEAHQRLIAAGPQVADLKGCRGKGMFAQLLELLRRTRHVRRAMSTAEGR